MRRKRGGRTAFKPKRGPMISVNNRPLLDAGREYMGPPPTRAEIVAAMKAYRRNGGRIKRVPPSPTPPPINTVGLDKLMFHTIPPDGFQAVEE